MFFYFFCAFKTESTYRTHSSAKEASRSTIKSPPRSQSAKKSKSKNKGRICDKRGNVKMGNAEGFDFVKQCHRQDTKLANQVVWEMAAEAEFGKEIPDKDTDKSCDDAENTNSDEDESESKECCLCDESAVPSVYSGSNPWSTIGKDTQTGKEDVHTYCLNAAYNFKRKILSHDSNLCDEFKRLWTSRVDN